MKGRGPCHDRVRRERLLGSGVLPSFRDVIRHFELLGRLRMDFPSQTPVIFSLSPVSRVPFLFVLFSLMIPVSCSLFCFWTESPSLICLTIQNGGWHHGKRALRSPLISRWRVSFSVVHKQQVTNQLWFEERDAVIFSSREWKLWKLRNAWNIENHLFMFETWFFFQPSKIFFNYIINPCIISNKYQLFIRYFLWREVCRNR